MKKTIALFVCLLVATVTMAQSNQKFSPEKFQANLEAYITKEAKLTDEEAKRFFPLYREMHQKQRGIYSRMQKVGIGKPADEKKCAAAIQERDKLDIELRQLAQSYHKKMLQVIPASKLYDVINAENGFHRQMMKGWQAPRGGWQAPPRGGWHRQQQPQKGK